MTSSDMAAILRSIKVPQAMVNSKALVDFLLEKTERGGDEATAEETQQLMTAMIGSQLEVINALGTLEAGAADEMSKKVDQAYDEFKANIVKPEDFRKPKGFLGFLRGK